MDRVISDIRICPIARDCRNNSCIMRMIKVFNYTLEPSIDSERQKVKDIESKFGKGHVPKMKTLFKDGMIQVICEGFKNK